MSLTADEGTITEAVVHRLLQGLENKGHHVFMDNFYSGPHLYKELKKKGFGACGTVRLNRKGMPAEWKGKNEKSKNGGTRKRKGTEILKKGEMRSVDLKNGLLALQWRDKRVVNMISTIHNSDNVIKKRRTRQARDGQEDIRKPKMIDEYNKYMGGVDKSDQFLSYYGFNHRTVKWWKRAAFHLLDLAVVNSYILYQQSEQTHYLSHEHFRIQLAEELLLISGMDVSAIPPPSSRRISLPPPARLIERHFPSKISTRNGKQIQLDCTLCSNRKEKRKTTIYCCVKCDIALCVVPCFEHYHTRINLNNCT